MLNYIDEDIAELIVLDIVDFYEVYIATKSLTMNQFDVRNEDDKTITIHIDNSTNYRRYFALIKRISRTKVSFFLLFEKDEIDWAMRLYHMLDGYIFVDLKNYSKIEVNFTLDLGSKQNCLDYFKKLQT
ncbi:hypothetical protein D3C81_339400 [compost metagenome]